MTEITGIKSGSTSFGLDSQLLQFFTRDADLRRLLSTLAHGFDEIRPPGQVRVKQVVHISKYRIEFALLDFTVCSNHTPLLQIDVMVVQEGFAQI